MPNCIIYNNGNQINRIVASEEFCQTYCQKHGYTYEVEPDPEPRPRPDPEPTETPVTWSALASAIKEGVNEV